MADDATRLPPHSPEAEQGVLAAFYWRQTNAPQGLSRRWGPRLRLFMTCATKSFMNPFWHCGRKTRLQIWFQSRNTFVTAASLIGLEWVI